MLEELPVLYVCDARSFLYCLGMHALEDVSLGALAGLGCLMSLQLLLLAFLLNPLVGAVRSMTT